MVENAIVNCAAYCEGIRVANVDIDDVSDILKQSDKFVWIGLHEPGTELLAKIQKQFGLHDLAVEDTHRAHQRPKIEAYGDTLFIVLRTVQMHEKQIDLGETHFFVGRNFIITVRHGSSLAYTDVRTRCESTPFLLQKGPAFALYAVMDAIVDQYFPVIDALGEERKFLTKHSEEKQPHRSITSNISCWMSNVPFHL
jgi:magnesium transporter